MAITMIGSNLRGGTSLNMPTLDVDGYLPSAPEVRIFNPAMQAETANPARSATAMPALDNAVNKASLVDSGELTTSFGTTKSNPITPGVSDSYKNAKTAAAGLSFMVDVMNANSAYRNVAGQAQMNIAQARNQGNDALFRGRQAQLDRQSEGYNAGQDATLAMAAQGQDVNGSAVGKVRGSYEAMGIMNGMREEINAIREALGFELEEIQYDYQTDMARTNRDFAIIGSALNFGAQAAAYRSM